MQFRPFAAGASDFSQEPVPAGNNFGTVSCMHAQNFQGMNRILLRKDKTFVV